MAATVVTVAATAATTMAACDSQARSRRRRQTRSSGLRGQFLRPSLQPDPPSSPTPNPPRQSKHAGGARDEHSHTACREVGTTALDRVYSAARAARTYGLDGPSPGGSASAVPPTTKHGTRTNGPSRQRVTNHTIHMFTGSAHTEGGPRHPPPPTTHPYRWVSIPSSPDCMLGSRTRSCGGTPPPPPPLLLTSSTPSPGPGRGVDDRSIMSSPVGGSATSPVWPSCSLGGRSYWASSASPMVMERYSSVRTVGAWPSAMRSNDSWGRVVDARAGVPLSAESIAARKASDAEGTW